MEEEQIEEEDDRGKEGKRGTTKHCPFLYRFTVKAEEPPVIEETYLMGCTIPVNLIGKHMKTIKDNPIYAFQGIMYGEAMLGDLRFKVRERKKSIEGIKE